jgi:8-oxo-dGTP diphosphatase
MSVSAGYCTRCAHPLAAAPPTTCAGCGYEMYLVTRPTGSVIVVRDGEFLALVRAREPNAGRWDLPGGFCEAWEHPRDAAVREAREELGVEVALSDFVGMYLGCYEYQGEILPVLDCFWQATIVAGELVVDPDEACDHAWLPLADPPPMAFATMDRALGELAPAPAGRVPEPTR